MVPAKLPSLLPAGGKRQKGSVVGSSCLCHRQCPAWDLSRHTVPLLLVERGPREMSTSQSTEPWSRSQDELLLRSWSQWQGPCREKRRHAPGPAGTGRDWAAQPQVPGHGQPRELGETVSPGPAEEAKPSDTSSSDACPPGGCPCCCPLHHGNVTEPLAAIARPQRVHGQPSPLPGTGCTQVAVA